MPIPEPVPGGFTADSGVTADTGAFDASGGLIAFARVQAMAPGFYRGVFRNIGDVFDIFLPGDYAAYNVSLVPPGNPLYPLYGWMRQVASNAPLVDFSLANSGASSQVQTTPGVNGGGQQVQGQAVGIGNEYVV